MASKSQAPKFHLTPEIATEFGQTKAQRKELAKIEENLADQIKEVIEDTNGVVTSTTKGTNGDITTYSFAPPESPYEIQMSVYDQIDVSWKDEFEKLYVKLYGMKKYNEFVNSLALKEARKLDAKPNAFWEGEKK